MGIRKRRGVFFFPQRRHVHPLRNNWQFAFHVGAKEMRAFLHRGWCLKLLRVRQQFLSLAERNKYRGARRVKRWCKVHSRVLMRAVDCRSA